MSSAEIGRGWRAVARAIDHTLLKPEATREAISKLCQEALEYGFCAVCVQPSQVALVRRLLDSSGVKTASVIGFPQGATLTTAKRFEAAEVVRLGAQELDMVINVGALKSGDHVYVRNDIRAVAEVTHAGGAILKVIIEAALLTKDEKGLACELAVAAGADFVKTSTGFGGGGATVEDVALMRSVVGPNVGVKASGGIRTAADAIAMLKAGANRLGTSGSVGIVKEISNL
ncbi:MAG: deoxyribose-phosphate aldolase [Terriglobales bacterium]